MLECAGDVDRIEAWLGTKASRKRCCITEARELEGLLPCAEVLRQVETKPAHEAPTEYVVKERPVPGCRSVPTCHQQWERLLESLRKLRGFAEVFSGEEPVYRS